MPEHDNYNVLFLLDKIADVANTVGTALGPGAAATAWICELSQLNNDVPFTRYSTAFSPNSIAGESITTFESPATLT